MFYTFVSLTNADDYELYMTLKDFILSHSGHKPWKTILKLRHRCCLFSILCTYTTVYRVNTELNMQTFITVLVFMQTLSLDKK